MGVRKLQAQDKNQQRDSRLSDQARTLQDEFRELHGALNDNHRQEKSVKQRHFQKVQHNLLEPGGVTADVNGDGTQGEIECDKVHHRIRNGLFSVGEVNQWQPEIADIDHAASEDEGYPVVVLQPKKPSGKVRDDKQQAGQRHHESKRDFQGAEADAVLDNGIKDKHGGKDRQRQTGDLPDVRIEKSIIDQCHADNDKKRQDRLLKDNQETHFKCQS